MRTVSAMASVAFASGALMSEAAFAEELAAQATLTSDGSASASAGGEESASASAGGEAFEPGFETGLRLGAGVPIGKAGESPLLGDVDVKDMAPLRTAAWIDVGYRLSERTTLGVYGQIGFGETGDGDACAGDCDWSDLRIGIQGQWRLADADASPKPWLGVGLGYESLSFRTLVVVPVTMDGGTREVPIRAAEKLGGPELLLQLGLDFRVEDSLDIGPYVSATLAHYMGDRLTCDGAALCDNLDVIDASGFHSWLGVGLRGAYTP